LSTRPKQPETKKTDSCILDGKTGRNPEPILKRRLTDNETGFYARLFGQSVNLTDTCIYLYKKPPEAEPNIATDVLEDDTKIITVYGKKNYSEDYTKEENSYLFGTIAYEITHLMQHQKETHENEPDSSVSNEFNELSGYDLNDYTDAQKRSMISDYVRFIFHPTGETTQLSKYGSGNCPAQYKLTATVENAFPNAEAMRHEHQYRKFTAPEKALILGIFGDQIRTVNDMGVRQQARCYGNAAASVDGGETETFDAWTRKHHAKDYTNDNIFNFGMFAHEVTHIWQHRVSENFTGGQSGEYSYPIDSKRFAFKDYFDEQQGAIIEDYVRYFLRPEHDTRRLKHTEEYLIGLQKIVEDQFPMAKTTREYFEENGKLPNLQTVQSWLKPQQKTNVPTPTT
jgi:hypothetical protein